MLDVLTIEAIIRAAWERGERDPDAVAKEVLRVALAAEDPAAVLLGLIRAEVQSRFRSFKKALEDEAGPLDRTKPRPPNDSGPAQATNGSHSAHGGAAQDQPADDDVTEEDVTEEDDDGQEATPLTDRQRLMAEKVWVPAKGAVTYADMTIADAQARIEWLKTTKAGIESSIKWLQAAIKAMKAAHVSRLGDLPDDDLPPPGEAGA